MVKKQRIYKVVTLGCRTNQYESQAYAKQLEALGYRASREGETADLCLVNTCTVTASADTESRRALRRLRRENPTAKVVATGCAVEGKERHVLEGVDVVVPNKEKEQLVEYLFPDLETYPEFSIERFAAHTRAFVKVQDGCNSFCSYCIIPYVRGRSRSRRLEDILEEVRGLVANGYKEVVLTGINIGDFDGQGTTRLADLVRAVDDVPGVERIRVSSIDPDEVDDDLANAILEGKRTCLSMHIVLQAGSNVVLKRMNRKYSRQLFLETVERLRNAHPDFTFTTDIIVGFPGETDRDFDETLEVMRAVRFAKVHMFPYSDRERTKAATFANKIPAGVIRERKAVLTHLSEQLAYELREEYVGRTCTVLTESREDPSWIVGHTDNFLRVAIKDRHLQPNQIVHVELLENSPDSLRGRYHVDAHYHCCTA